MSVVPFSVAGWTAAHLSRSAGNLVDRVVLIAAGVAHGTEGRWVTTAQISEMTGIAVDLVDDVIAEAIERGEVTRSGRKLYPVDQAASTGQAA